MISLGGQYYVNGLENQYGYPDFNTGYSRSCLLARKMTAASAATI